MELFALWIGIKVLVEVGSAEDLIKGDSSVINGQKDPHVCGNTWITWRRLENIRAVTDSKFRMLLDQRLVKCRACEIRGFQIFVLWSYCKRFSEVGWSCLGIFLLGCMFFFPESIKLLSFNKKNLEKKIN